MWGHCALLPSHGRSPTSARLSLRGAAHQAGDGKPGIHGQNSRNPGVVATISCCPHLGRAASSEPPPCCDRLMGHSDVGRSWHSVGTHSSAAPSEVAARLEDGPSLPGPMGKSHVCCLSVLNCCPLSRAELRLIKWEKTPWKSRPGQLLGFFSKGCCVPGPVPASQLQLRCH